MRHFDFLDDDETQRLFFRAPKSFSPQDGIGRLAMGMGATLYTPATHRSLAVDIARRARQGLMSSVVCLEDAVADVDLAPAEANAIAQLRELAKMKPPELMVFVRVRSPEQIERIVTGLGEEQHILTGFVLPKFTSAVGSEFLDAVIQTGERRGRELFAMPVLEAGAVSYAESRVQELLDIRELLGKYAGTVLAVRIGATDLSSAYGLRRSRDLTAYDLRIVADVIADIVNILGRFDGTGHVITGPVWEYFSAVERIFKSQLRESPFIEHSEVDLRATLIARDLDGLIREVELDKANGLCGKTVIHPSHVAVIHALSVVTHEEYCDAVDIVGTSAGGGVVVSAYGNKMNESKPHLNWAHRVLDRADLFGVANEAASFVDLLGAGLNQ